MINALGTPQSLLLLGGTSDIALAVARRYAARGAGLRVVLAARPSERRTAAAAELTALGCGVEEVDLDAQDHRSHAATVEAAFAGGDVDVAVLAFGILGDQQRAETDADHAVEIATVDYVAAVSVTVPVSQALRDQGHGCLVVLSSVAAERPRRSNFVYGSAKAGLDAFATGLGDALRGSGVRVLVVRPGFVRTKMTAHLPPAPMSTTPEAVAKAVLSGVRRGKETVWAPAALRPVMTALRHTPRAVFRRLPL